MSSATDAGFDIPPIRPISGEQPWSWLAAGWRDMTRRPAVSLGYGVAFVLACYGIAALLAYLDLVVLLLPVAAGLVFVGPLMAVGLYEMSRRIEKGEPIRVWAIALVRTQAPAQITFMGLILAFFILAWVRLATLLFALFFGASTPPLPELLGEVLFTFYGLSFLGLGTAIGAGLAFAAFAISAVSIPRLLVQNTDVASAIMTSINAVRANFWPMLLWAWLIGLMTAFGVATLGLGLVVTFPLIGHATWHAYRATVAFDGQAPAGSTGSEGQA